MQPSEEQAAEAVGPAHAPAGGTPAGKIPSAAIERDAAARHDHVDMRMVRQG